MEAALIALTSGVGTILSVFFFVDAMRDRWLVRHADPPRSELEEVAFDQVVEEGIFLLLQLFFLVISLVTIISEHEALRRVSFYLLVSMPVLLMARSLYRWVRRKQILRGQGTSLSPRS